MKESVGISRQHHSHQLCCLAVVPLLPCRSVSFPVHPSWIWVPLESMQGDLIRLWSCGRSLHQDLLQPCRQGSDTWDWRAPIQVRRRELVPRDLVHLLGQGWKLMLVGLSFGHGTYIKK